MSLHQISRTVTDRIGARRRLQRIAHLPGGGQSPSERAIRSIDEVRSTFRW